ncbi:MAG: Gfo/Idh/MocA family oxidoreductase, partial [Candidatus Levybacteria bacterium]|nr:Gfo/Idh/MocA family oxidoreductase [Candidatus Levybacteria bacterium]
ERVNKIAVIDVDWDKRAKASAEGLDTYHNLGELLDRKVDVVIVAIPPAYNLETIQKIVSHGNRPRAILIEKPLATELADAEAIQQSLLKTDVETMVGLTGHGFHPEFRRAYELIQAGAIGEIKSAQTIRDVDLKLKKTEDGVRKLYDLVKATQPDEGYDLINPRSQQTVGKLNAYKVFLLITQLAWHYGDPGMIMIDRINKSGANPTPHLGQIEATNPCVTGDTIISTGEGLIPMKEVVESHFAGGKRFGGNMSLIIDTRTLNHKTGGTLPGRAVKFFDNGIKEVWRLTTKSGFTLTATPDHQLLTPKGWVKLRDLNTGDIVLIQSGRGEFGKNRQLPIISKIPTMPNDWSKELGMVLGWLIGDGWVRTGDKNCRVGFTFGKDDLDSLNYIQNLMNNWYGKDVKAVKRERNNTHLSYHSRGLVDFFVKLGVKPVKAADKLVPESIYTAPVEAVVGFLQGLFTADGTVNFKKGRNAYVRLTSKSKLLLQGVQLLLLNLGIYSKIYDRSRDSRMGMFPYKNKSGQLKTYTLDGVLFELSIAKQSVMKFLSAVGFLSDRHQDKISKFSTQDFYADKFVDTVSEIKPFGRQRVYDLTEEKSLTFITNGIVSLDCGEQPLLPYDACTLGSINLGKFVKDGQIDYQALGEVSQECVHFLDNVLDMNAYPIAEIAEMTRKVRRIGLGVMGLADLLVQVEIGYNTDDGLSLAEDVMAHIQESAKE